MSILEPDNPCNTCIHAKQAPCSIYCEVKGWYLHNAVACCKAHEALPDGQTNDIPAYILSTTKDLKCEDCKFYLMNGGKIDDFSCKTCLALSRFYFMDRATEEEMKVFRERRLDICKRCVGYLQEPEDEFSDCVDCANLGYVWFHPTDQAYCEGCVCHGQHYDTKKWYCRRDSESCVRIEEELKI